MNTEVFTCVGRSGWTYRIPRVEPKQWNKEAIQLWVHSSLQNQERCEFDLLFYNSQSQANWSRKNGQALPAVRGEISNTEI